MARGNRSGEIVNATLMEVFVVFSFMFLVYSTMVEDVSAGRIDRLVGELEIQKRELAQVEKRRVAADQLAVALKDKLDRLFPPLCEPYVIGQYYGTVVLRDGQRMQVYVKKAFLPHHRFEGDVEMSRNQFRKVFTGLRRYFSANNCRLSVVIVDETSPTNKRDYKSGERLVREYFNARLRYE